MDYIKKQNQLKKEAERIVKDLDLKKNLQKYGKVNFVGSFALDLIKEFSEALLRGRKILPFDTSQLAAG